MDAGDRRRRRRERHQGRRRRPRPVATSSASGSGSRPRTRRPPTPWWPRPPGSWPASGAPGRRWAGDRGRPVGDRHPVGRHRRRPPDRRPTSTPAGSTYPAAIEFRRALAHDVAIVNDADAAGVAEMRFGAGRGKLGDGVRADPRDRGRVGPVPRRRPRPEHRARPHGDPRDAMRSVDRRPTPGSGAACRGRPGRRISTSTSSRSIACSARTCSSWAAASARTPDKFIPLLTRPGPGRGRPSCATTRGSSGRRCSWPPAGGRRRPPSVQGRPRPSPARADHAGRSDASASYPRQRARRDGPRLSRPAPPSSRRRPVAALRPIARSTASRSAPRPRRSGRSSTTRLRSAGSCPAASRSSARRPIGSWRSSPRRSSS